MIINSKRVIRCLKHPIVLIQYLYLKSISIIGIRLSQKIKKKIDSCQFFITMGEKINWKTPADINQWIHYLSFEEGATKWSELADKYYVRNIVKESGFQNSLIEIYAHWNCVEDIDFCDLPNSFVLKMNNGCGDIRIIENKSIIDIVEIKEYFSKFFNKKYGENTIERHYTLIKPVILVERLLDKNAQGAPSFSMIDYKFWCFNGIPKVCFVVLNRTKSNFIIDLYKASADWERIETGNLIYNERHLYNTTPVPKPKSLDAMLRIASKLSQGHPQMRVDLYEENENVLFGELTMTSQAGKMDYFTVSFLREMGEWCKEAYFQLTQGE